ncbi:type IV secretion system protein [Fusobacterium gastrosuis]|uniref:type IV secretion system protein n=1 Tax=Fusobacterium gastrosuis TaxID=1755100 RepID=UPI002971CC6F|nr:type IV secretion system protein [Fusobacteriaceae bacterium]MDY5714298.1 type IV secretion system protein [Fusobacterium gastrosuis]
MFDLAGVVIEIIQKDSYTMITNFRPYVLSLLYTLCMLDLILNVSFGLLEAKENPFVKLAFSVFKYSFVGYIVNNYKEVLTIIIGGGIQLGNIALGKGSNTYFSTDLFKFLYDYILFASTVFLGVGGIATAVDIAFIESLPMVSMLFLGALLTFIFWCLISLIMQIGKVFLVSAFAYPLIVFIVLSKTKDIGMKALSAVISSGIYIYVVTTLLNMSTDIHQRISEYYPTTDTAFSFKSITQSFTNMISATIVSFIVFLLLKNADIIANMLSSGIIGALNEGGKGVIGFVQDVRSTSTAGQGQNPFQKNSNNSGFGKLGK